ncbi:hypothetical protein HNQ51_000117 [Inhella inkyongensis]|uniref:Uncharacterized protein n=1 Tax=Inhella inkyongensis TaxID=392593 RepID=A0A840S1T8_9BURK|nr:hypothetical protein [Inhella inkyongensis]
MAVTQGHALTINVDFMSDSPFWTEFKLASPPLNADA